MKHTNTQTGTRQTQPASFLSLLQPPPADAKTYIHTHTHGTSAAANDKWEQQLVETATQKEDTKKVSGIWQQRRRRRRHFLVSAYTRWKIGVHSIKHKKECKGKATTKRAKKKRDLFEIKRANNKKRKTEKTGFYARAALATSLSHTVLSSSNVCARHVGERSRQTKCKWDGNTRNAMLGISGKNNGQKCMLTNTHYATSLYPPLPLAQPKTTDKRFFFLNGCRLTTPQAKVKKAEKEKKTMTPRWACSAAALLGRCDDYFRQWQNTWKANLSSSLAQRATRTRTRTTRRKASGQ